MTEEKPRRRASAMSPQQRREAIVEAVLPLVRAHGAHLTTRQIAQAAGIAEGTVFRAFQDKAELLSACVAAALNPGELCEQIRALPRDAGLADRLAAAAELFLDHFSRVGELVHALAASGFDLRGGMGPAKAGPVPDMRERFLRDLNAAVASLVDPREVRIPPEDLASYLQAMILGIRFTATASDTSEADRTADIRARVDALLHGALATDRTGGSR